MSTSFEKYNDVLLDAFKNNSRSHEIITKKKEILSELFDYHGIDIKHILFVGFNPGILDCRQYQISVTQVSQEAQDFLTKAGVNFKVIDLNTEHKFDVIIATDEYFTFAETDQDQKDLVENLSRSCRNFIITTLKDYKNQDFKEREFSYPVVVKDDSGKRIYLEHYEFDNQDRNLSFGTNYIIADDGLTLIGPFARRNMFFKQLARFSLDCGASNFLVHKNLMHKSIIKKNYEHIITIKF